MTARFWPGVETLDCGYPATWRNVGARFGSAKYGVWPMAIVAFLPERILGSLLVTSPLETGLCFPRRPFINFNGSCRSRTLSYSPESTLLGPCVFPMQTGD